MSSSPPSASAMASARLALPSTSRAEPSLAATRRPESRRSVAPMMDWTDRHCRSFHRLLSSTAWLYTEMVTSQAVIHGDRERLLGRGDDGERVVLQLGGNDPVELARAAAIGASFGYAEINLNCGCPSDRVREGAFGACLMADPGRVADCVAAMIAAQPRPVTVKHRIGLDRGEDYGFVERFVERVAEAGCRRFIVHARNAWLDGLSPRENREIPPLRYDVVSRLVADFPALAFELNGGLTSLAAAEAAEVEAQARGVAVASVKGDVPMESEVPVKGDVPMQSEAPVETRASAETVPPVNGEAPWQTAGPRLAGVMFGRAAYHDPWLLIGIDPVPPAADRHQVAIRLADYLVRHRPDGVRLRDVARHVLGLYHGRPGARHWRRELSTPAVLAADDPMVLVRLSAELTERPMPPVQGPLPRRPGTTVPV